MTDEEWNRIKPLAEELTDAVWTAHVNGLSYPRLGEFRDRVIERLWLTNRRVA